MADIKDPINQIAAKIAPKEEVPTVDFGRLIKDSFPNGKLVGIETGARRASSPGAGFLAGETLGDVQQNISNMGDADRRLVVEIPNPDEPSNPVTKRINIDKYMAANKIDPTKANLAFNTPDTPTAENVVGFALGSNLAMARTVKDKARLLTDEFGAGNIKVRSNGDIVVKDKDGIWKSTTSGEYTMDTIAKEIGSKPGLIPAAIVGGKLGAELVAPFAPMAGPYAPAVIGTGSIIGAVLATVAADYASLDYARKTGIRTDLDAETMKRELKTDMRNDVLVASAISLGIPAVIGGTKIVGKTASKIVEKIARPLKKLLDQGLDVDTIAGRLASQSKAPKSAFKTVLSSNENAQAVNKWMQEDIKHLQSVEARVASGEPVEQFMTKSDKRTIEVMKQSLNKFNNNVAMDKKILDKTLRGNNAINNTTVDVTKQVSDFHQTLQSTGINYVRDSKTGLYKIVDSGVDEITTQLSHSGTKTALEDTLNQMDKAARKGKLGYEELNRMVLSLDNLLTSSSGDTAIIKAYKGKLYNLRGNLAASRANTINDIPINYKGQRQSAREIFINENNRFHKFSKEYDQWAPLLKKGKSERQIILDVNRLTGDNKFTGLEDSFANMAAQSGANVSPIYKELQILSSARHLLSDQIASSSGKEFIYKNTLGMSPRQAAIRAIKKAPFLEKVNNMRLNPINTVPGVQPAIRPSSESDLIALKAAGEANKFVKGLSHQDKLNLVLNANAWDSFLQATQAPVSTNIQATQELNQQIQGAGNQQ